MKMYMFVSPCCVAFEDRECSRVTLRGKMLSLHACFFRGDLGTLLIMFGSVMSMYRLSILIMLSPFMIDKGSQTGFWTLGSRSVRNRHDCALGCREASFTFVQGLDGVIFPRP
jgi:hypothetical protein